MKLYNQHRKAFSMFTAITVIVLMSTVAILIMNVSGKIVKETTAQYQREQALLLANSYTEYAVMAVTANDRSGDNCLRTINGTQNGYSAQIEIAYIGTAAEMGSCEGTRKLSQTVSTESTPLTIIVDAYISYNDLDNPSGEDITYHRRTVQKI
ncbi:MAG: type II secretion system protein [Campylobacterota bacterium]|nr:type II secretion system protein [Campylobacterota bacterium]